MSLRLIILSVIGLASLLAYDAGMSGFVAEGTEPHIESDLLDAVSQLYAGSEGALIPNYVSKIQFSECLGGANVYEKRSGNRFYIMSSRSGPYIPFLGTGVSVSIVTYTSVVDPANLFGQTDWFQTKMPRSNLISHQKIDVFRCGGFLSVSISGFIGVWGNR